MSRWLKHLHSVGSILASLVPHFDTQSVQLRQGKTDAARQDTYFSGCLSSGVLSPTTSAATAASKPLALTPASSLLMFSLSTSCP